MNPISIYFHVPYCRNKCIYCDFYSGGTRIADWNALASAFLNEFQSRKDEWQWHEVVSIYLGGGTPSLMPTDILEYLFERLREIIGRDSIANDCEVTMEVNPEDVSEENIAAWKRCGINRVSIGIQTFNDELLRTIRRRHTGEEAYNALKELIRNFNNVSADIIFGLPGQQLGSVEKDLQLLKELNPEHVSVYSLMYEPGTALTILRDAGKVKSIDENQSAKMFEVISAFLKEAGYVRYEISNYSYPGFESRHNSGYWTGRKYVGIGPSAHSFDGEASRKSNPADLKGYLKRWKLSSDSVPKIQSFHSDKAKYLKECIEEKDKEKSNYEIECEYLTEEEQKEEMIMLSLRMSKGLDLNLFEKRFGSDALTKILHNAKRGIESKQFEIIPDNHLRITDNGLMISDSLIIELI